MTALQTHATVKHGLRPGNQAQSGQDLRLNLQGDMLMTEYVVDAKWKTRNRPQDHHRG